jgi:tetratricopeptide (TPR) repeat protein
MRLRSLPILLASLLLAPVAFADYGTPPPPPPSTPAPAGSRAPDGTEMTPRQQAERYFADAYDDVVKGGKEVGKGRKDAALKRYRRALERSRHAVELDSTYHEAWNLVGFTSRKLGDYPASFAAYQVALRLKPDFALAREYYGEGLLETGDLAGARGQLVALRTCGTPELIAELETAIKMYEAAHPGVGAKPDSAKSGG